jgi:hypothetical protein
LIFIQYKRQQDDLKELREALKLKYPDLKYEIIVINGDTREE